MGYAYTANIIGDPFGIFSNPAHIPDFPMIGIAYSSVFNDGKNFSEESAAAFSFLYPDLFFGVNLGIAAVSSLEGNIENEQDAAVYLNLSRRIKFLSFGVNAKYIDSKFHREAGSDFIAADAGLSATFGIVTIGAAGYNLFGGFKDAYGKKINPSLGADISVDLDINNFMFQIEAGATQKNIDEDKINPRAGFEIFYRAAALRCGYEYDKDLKDRGLFFAGFGLDIKNVIFDYAFIADQNESGNGDVHKAALSYRFYRLSSIVSEQFKQQIQYEKQQLKLEKNIKKQQIKIDKSAAKEGNFDNESLKQKFKDKDLAGFKDYGDEFAAVLLSEDNENPADSAASSEENETMYRADETMSDDFDAAAYLLESGRSNASAAGHGEENGMESKTYKSDYDPAEELLAASGITKKTGKKVPPKNTAKKTASAGSQKYKIMSKEKIKQAELEAEKARLEAAKVQISVEDNEFDAARYVLENPGQGKVKQYYVQPTKTSKDDFDAANYLLEMEKRENP